jgi:hypothetical protein
VLNRGRLRQVFVIQLRPFGEIELPNSGYFILWVMEIKIQRGDDIFSHQFLQAILVVVVMVDGPYR